jgi:hypothetical protein
MKGGGGVLCQPDCKFLPGMSKYPGCSVARIAIYPDCRQKIQVAARIFAKTELFGSQISPGMLPGMIYLLVLSLVVFFTFRAKSCPNMRNPEVFCNECGGGGICCPDCMDLLGLLCCPECICPDCRKKKMLPG